MIKKIKEIIMVWFKNKPAALKKVKAKDKKAKKKMAKKIKKASK